MRAAWTLARKDLLLTLRQPADWFFIVVFPIGFAIFFSTIFGGLSDPSPTLALVVSDEDRSEASRQLLERIEARDGVTVERVESATRGQRLVRQGGATAYVRIPAGFGARLGEAGIGNLAGLVGDGGSVPGLQGFASGPEVSLVIDPQRAALGGWLEGILQQEVGRLIGERLEDPALWLERVRSGRRALDAATTLGVTPGGLERGEARQIATGLRAVESWLSREVDATDAPTDTDTGTDPPAPTPASNNPEGSLFSQPVTIDVQPVGPSEPGEQRNIYDVTVPQGLLWAMLGCVATFGVSLVAERRQGTLMRLRTLPIPSVTILASKAFACFLAILMTTGLLIGLAHLAFDFQVAAPLKLLVALIGSGIGFTGLMMLLAVVSKSETAASGIGWAVLLVMAMLGGAMVPVFIMPDWAQTASGVSPVSWSISALEGASWRRYDWGDLLAPVGLLSLFGLVSFAIGSLVLHRRR